MSTRRGGYRRRKQSNSYQQKDETWTSKPILDEQPRELIPQFASSSSHENLEQATTTAAAAVSASEFIPNNQKNQQNRRNYRGGGTRGRRPHTIKDQFVKKSEVGSLNSDEKSEEREADSGDEVGFKLEKESNVDETVQENGVKEEIKQGSDLDEADDVKKRLKKLVLNAEEPQLSEEQLRINDQAQEDEVNSIINCLIWRI